MLSRIAEEIAASGGWISFARYMELALYEPRLGYYTGGERKLGRDGDFVTAPELGKLFARTLSRQLKELVGKDEAVLEVGAGSGALADALITDLGCPYLILETSPDLRRTQEDRLGSRARWLDDFPERFRGVVIANEVLDAMPVHAVAWTAEGIMERGVALGDQGLEWRERPAAGELLERAAAIAVEPRYESEIGLIGQAWLRTLGERLERGVMLLIDYGFARREYYHPQRAMGTLMCHHRHRSHGEVFYQPGRQDLTAHVDFSALAAAAGGSGLELLGYATQAQFLVNCGITDVLGEANVENALHYAPLAAEAQRLLSPAEMGELFKVLAVGRDAQRTLRRPLLGFTRGDRAHTL